LIARTIRRAGWSGKKFTELVRLKLAGLARAGRKFRAAVRQRKAVEVFLKL
jgi:hypothetical protein